MVMEEISWSDFERVSLRAGTVVKVEEFAEARKPAYKLWIDFGANIGIKKSSAQITKHYTVNSLMGKQVLAVVNFPEKQIGPFRSQVLVTGFADGNGDVVLVRPDKAVPNGTRLF